MIKMTYYSPVEIDDTCPTVVQDIKALAAETNANVILITEVFTPKALRYNRLTYSNLKRLEYLFFDEFIIVEAGILEKGYGKEIDYDGNPEDFIAEKLLELEDYYLNKLGYIDINHDFGQGQTKHYYAMPTQQFIAAYEQWKEDVKYSESIEFANM